MTNAYVEATFQKRRVRTIAREGTSPQWNESLSLEIKTPNDDLSPKSLLESEIGMERLYLNLFDEITIDMLEVFFDKLMI
jgi:hypothetical protein